MLSELRVKNYALIKDLVFKPGKGFNVITGETGAGKSILLGAIGLVIGDRAESVSVKQNEEKCSVEATFQIKDYALNDWFELNDLDYSEELIIRREIAITGKSRAFINDTPAQLTQLKELGKFLIDIHSQHDNLDLFQKSFQFQIIDSFAELDKEVSQYKRSFNQLKQLKQKLNDLKTAAAHGENERDFKQFLYDELIAANIQPNEIEGLEEELTALSHADTTIQVLSSIHNQMVESENALLDQLAGIRNLLNGVAKSDKRFEEIAHNFTTLSLELKEIEFEMGRLAANTNVNPERLEFLNQRLNLLNNLNAKHKGEELTKVLERLSTELEGYFNLEDEILLTGTEIEALENTCRKIAMQMSEIRVAKAHILESEINKQIVNLGMPGAQIKVEITSDLKAELTIFGLDDANFLFSPAVGKLFNPIQNIASGGEISRVMLVLKSILAHKKVMPTLIFDEIDTGVSGEVAFKMGQMLDSIAKNMQLMAITHLPQIAARGQNHFYVYKKTTDGQTASDIRQLSKEERIAEVAEMIGGKAYTEAVYESAKQLLN